MIINNNNNKPLFDSVGARVAKKKCLQKKWYNFKVRMRNAFLGFVLLNKKYHKKKLQSVKVSILFRIFTPHKICSLVQF